MTDAARSADWDNAIARARAHSPFLCGTLDKWPELQELLAEGQGEEALAWAQSFADGDEEVGARLRHERVTLAAALAVGDLAGAFPVGRVMQELSDCADRSLDTAINAAIRRRVPDAEPAGLIGIALGKHGAGELNYSSDIDPILLYDPQSLPKRERDEPAEAAQRYAREVVRLLSDNTAEGFVFRVDLRLRPASEISPLAISVNGALTHYESSALTWERAAFIRARAASGDIAAGQEFLDAIRPFVWRRSLDFGAIEEIGRLTGKIRTTHKGPSQPMPGFNVKQGRGGIREVEFFAQTYQLIHGGRDPSLRSRNTRKALDALAAAALITRDDAAAMGAAYDRLRTIEHRLQMVNDRQTHTLPEGEALENVAALGGYPGAQALLEDLQELTGTVADRFDRLIDVDDTSPTPVHLGDALTRNLGQLGFEQPEAMAERVRSWSDGHIRALKSPAALSAFEAILPALLEALAEAPDPHRALLRWEAFLTKASSAINLFRLLEARPGLFEQLINILTLADPLAEELGRHPERLDALIDRSALDLPGSVSDLIKEMAKVEATGDYERILDRLRFVTGERRFALGVQLIEAAHDPLEIAAGLSRLAEAGLSVAAEAATREFAKVHGRIADSELIILGLGRLGGGALTHASDLDIVYVFTGTYDQQSDGERPLGATMYYNRLAQRISAALSVPTAHGALYEVDTRLRPQGAQGPLAVSMDSFARYQAEDAWTWEHMALTRARAMTGPPGLRQGLRDSVLKILRMPRDAEKLRDDVLSMRSDMAQHKQPKGALDAKLMRGGLVDLEFLVHFLQLRDGAALNPNLREAIDELVRVGLVGPELLSAHDLLTRLLVASRLFAPDLAEPSPAIMQAMCKACMCGSREELLHSYDDARQSVAHAWKNIFQTVLEI